MAAPFKPADMYRGKGKAIETRHSSTLLSCRNVAWQND
jgi:hypothetical protein